MSERMFNVSLAHKLDSPERVLWLPPREVVNALGVASGETIADLGAGTGYFSLPLAEAVGPEGRIYAVDAQGGMLEHLRKKLESAGRSNVVPALAEAHRTHLPGSSCDRVFLANVWHEFADRTAVLHESLRLLKDKGRLAILDWRPDVEPEPGPPLSHRLSASLAIADLVDAGFVDVTHRNIGTYSWLVQATSGDRERNGTQL